MSLQKAHDPAAIFREVVYDLRIMGPVYCCLAILALFFGLTGSRGQAVRILSAVNAVLLIGPGAWYLIVAWQLNKLSFTLIRPTFWVAIVQAVLVMCVLAVQIKIGWRMPGEVFIPAALAMFFIPAVIATAWHLWRLQQVVPTLLPSSMAFEPTGVKDIPVARAIPVESDGGDERGSIGSGHSAT